MLYFNGYVGAYDNATDWYGVSRGTIPISGYTWDSDWLRDHGHNMEGYPWPIIGWFRGDGCDTPFCPDTSYNDRLVVIFTHIGITPTSSESVSFACKVVPI